MALSAKERTARYREKHEVKKSLEKFTGIEGIDYVECKLCGHLYVKWENFEEMRENGFK